MGVVTYEFEVTSPVAPTRLFKAFVLEGAKVYPKAAPHAIKSVELEGDGKPGSIVKINFVEGLPFQYMKHMIGGHDESNLSYSYSLIEGGPLGTSLRKLAMRTNLWLLQVEEVFARARSNFTPLATM
ncbi:hypothetical protein ERO13_D10G176000v2 [Gossypium hirsutum]|nr:hypothetical protein ERO13_D10G176000v2 [Gossypium hirsutum]KAG4126763.1 hypothetical protein ERO13_D10G176000v2 [Gossypium hirsutum]